MKQPRTQDHNNHPLHTLWTHAPRVIVKRLTVLERAGFTPSEAVAFVVIVITLFFI